MSLTKEEIRTDVQLRLDRFNTQEIAEFRKVEVRYFTLLKQLEQALAEQDYHKVIGLEDRVYNLECILRYQGKDTRDVPVDVFKKLLHEGEFGSHELKTAFQRIKNPATAIRAFCTHCMNGQVAEIRRCQAVTCPLWAFRLGQNPFFGKKLPPVALVTFDDSEDVAVEDDASEGVDSAD